MKECWVNVYRNKYGTQYGKTHTNKIDAELTANWFADLICRIHIKMK
jgi:hypothetical protein